MQTPLTRRAMTDLAVRACETMMKKYSAPDLPPAGHFHYHQGVFLSGVRQTWELTGERKYFDYIKAWVDSCVRPDGNIMGFNPGQLDDLQPGVLLFPLYDETREERYRLAMDTIAHYMRTFATTPEGGFWHKAWYRNQMWLDGLYMAGPFMTEYAVRFNRPDMIRQVLFQASMMRDKTRVPESGLWRHGWDWEKRQPWADPETGRSPEFWGRSMGWVPIALLQEYELLPEGNAERDALAAMACDLLKALLPWQDAASGLWYQVVDKGGEAGNWLESSCTCLYAAALFMAERLGLMDAEARSAAGRACAGILARLKSDENGLIIDNICVGTSVGDYAYYCSRPTGANDLHGVGAFLLLCAEAAKCLPA